ncbi:MAG: hypothetical protein AAFN30_11220, partial [Actinomycetota bacterium]
LVERRSASIGDNLQRLKQHVADLAECDAAGLADAVSRWLDEVGPAIDDVVVVRVAKEACPPSAG